MGESFGQWLKTRREERGLTLRDVERLTQGHVSNALLSQIETGKVKDPGISKVVFLAATYGLPADDVLDRARNGNQPLRAPDFCPHCGQLMRPERVDF